MRVRVTMHGAGEATTEPMDIDEAIEAIRAAWRQLRDSGKVPDGGTVEMHVEVRPRGPREEEEES